MVRARWWFAILLSLVLDGCDTAPVLQRGDPAPDLALERLDGQTLRFPEELTGRPVVIRFWADWCPFCRDEMAGLERIHQGQKEGGVVILAVNTGQDRATAQRFVDSLGLTYPTLLDPQSEAARRYGVIGLPTTFLVNSDGRIRSKLLGETDHATMARLIAGLAGDKP